VFEFEKGKGASQLPILLLIALKISLHFVLKGLAGIHKFGVARLHLFNLFLPFFGLGLPFSDLCKKRLTSRARPFLILQILLVHPAFPSLPFPSLPTGGKNKETPIIYLFPNPSHRGGGQATATTKASQGRLLPPHFPLRRFSAPSPLRQLRRHPQLRRQSSTPSPTTSIPDSTPSFGRCSLMPTPPSLSYYSFFFFFLFCEEIKRKVFS